MRKTLLLLAAVLSVAAILPVWGGNRPALVVKDTPALHRSATLTVDGWFLLPEELPADASPRLVSKYGHLEPKQRGWELVLEKGHLAFRVNCLFPNDDQRDFQLVSSREVPRGRWTHLAAVFADEGNGLRTLYIYIDGQPDGKMRLPDYVDINPNTGIDIFAGLYAGSVYTGQPGSLGDFKVDDLRLSGAIIPFQGPPQAPADPNLPGTLALFSFDGPAYAAPGVVAGVVGEMAAVEGRFGQALDLTGKALPETFKQATMLGRPERLEDTLYGDFRLIVHTTQENALLQLHQTKAQRRELALEIIDDENGQCVHKARMAIDGEAAAFSVPLAGLHDGHYTARVTEATGGLEGELVRRLRLQRPLPLKPPQEPIPMDGTLVFPVDDFHFAKREGVAHRVRQPEITLTTGPLDPAHGFQWSSRPDWFVVTKDGRIQQNFAAAAMWDGQGAEWFHATGNVNGGTWRTEAGLASAEGSLATVAYPLPPEMPKIRWHNRGKFDDSEVRLYTQADGPVSLTEVRAACIAPHIGNAAAKGFVNWGTYPVMERKKGEWIILNKEPLCVAKFGFTETEMESPLDANDNFGGQFISDDGKSLFYFQAAKLHCFAPRAVPYDNIADSFRLMRVFSSQDGFQWQWRFVAIPDEKDPGALQHYGMTTVRVTGDFRLGLLHAYDVEKQQIYSELIYSRDGLEWRRLDDRTPFLPNTTAPGSPFFGMIFADLEATPVYEYKDDFYLAMGSRWHQRPHFYFCYSTPADDPVKYDAKALERTYGNRQLAERWPYFEAVGGWEGLAQDYRRFHDGEGCALGYAKFPRNRWVAVASDGEGTLTGRLWSAAGKTLWLNGKGEFMVELLDAEGNPIQGYAGDAAAHFSGDSTAAPLRFGAGTALPPTPFRAIVRLRHAELYTLEIK